MKKLLQGWRRGGDASEDGAGDGGSTLCPGTHGRPAPEQPLYAVGDVHGRADLLESLLTRIDEHIVEQGVENAWAVLLGDYIDRGDQSAEVLELLHRFSRVPDLRIVCLMGNHERMMLDFLDAPEERGRRWLRNGGLQTLASYRIGGVTETLDPSQMGALAHDLRSAMPPGLEAWLRRLPKMWQNGNVVMVHAGADPARPPAEQSRTLLWGHPRFMSTCRTDDLWLVHGHVVVDEPICAHGRISLDTGAYAGGPLSGCYIPVNGEVEFLQV